MRCDNTDACLEQIRDYFSREPTGYFLVVNTENYTVYQEILYRLETDSRKQCVYMSQNCFPNGLPDVDTAIAKATGMGHFVLIGLSQAQMLCSCAALTKTLDEVLHWPIRGHSVILLEHCEPLLQSFLRRDIRLQKQVILVAGETSPLPSIQLANSADACREPMLLSGFPKLLAQLERWTDTKGDTKSKSCQTMVALSPFPIHRFQNAMYAITAVADGYETLIRKYADLAGTTEKSYGTNEQWNWLATQLAKREAAQVLNQVSNQVSNQTWESASKGALLNASFSVFVYGFFGNMVKLSAHIATVWKTGDNKKKWFLWLSMKILGEPDNHYLTYVLKNCDCVDSFEEHIYLDFAAVDVADSLFSVYYTQRKWLIAQLPVNASLVKRYCDKLGRYQKKEVFYLTDGSEQEKYHFFRCLSLYDFTKEELHHAVSRMSKALALYMKDFVFTAVNTRLPESEDGFRDDLTAYFRAYKRQKLTNRLFPSFLEKVEQYALSPRPYNKLPSRSSLLSHIDKNHTHLFFFDALGVEYLAFILAKCEEYNLESEVAIGHCELPSITVNNKEFLAGFPEDQWVKIDALDELKHHSLVYDYRQCAYPLYLFQELDIIDQQLRKIQFMLLQETGEKVLIVADHGASRLAVRYGHEVDGAIALDESGEHSGRCCPIERDPNLPYAAYENGFAVLANYERFKGGRRANVEVHGGASLEEVIVPIITLTKRPENRELYFVESVIWLKPHVIPELTLYSNVPLQKPRLLIGGVFYDGVLLADRKLAKFTLASLKRKGDYSAEVYDGEKNLSVKLAFQAQKQTREVDLF